MKIAFFELEGWEEDIIRNNFPSDELFFYKEKLNESLLPAVNDLDIISVFVGSRITAKVLDYFPNLKCITTRSTGFDHIDSAECKKRGISVLFVPGYGDNTVAEFTFGLMLNLTRKIYPAIDRIKESRTFSPEGLRGTDLKGKILGIVGTGRIGRQMIKIGKGFGMDIVAYDPYPDVNFAKEQNYEYLPLEELLRSSDIISIHCPYSEKTRHLFNKDNMKLIKKGAYLINTARGGIVETEALIVALKTRNLAGAALDVLEEEGETMEELEFLSGGHPNEEKLKIVLENNLLMNMPNVLITPHNAFNSSEAMEFIVNTTVSNIRSFISGNPINIVQ